MLGRVDMFCAADDRHRVALLEELLQQAGQPVTLHAQPLAEASDPCLVACTARSLKEAWIVELLGAHPAVVALRLDHTPLPVACLRAIELQSWPARSADRKVGALVTWLSTYDPGRSRARSHPGTPPPPALQKEQRPRRSRRGRGSDTRRAMIVLGVLLAGGYLLWSHAPERRRNDTPVDLTAIPAEPVSTPSDGTLSSPVDPTSIPASPTPAAGAVSRPRSDPTSTPGAATSTHPDGPISRPRPRLDPTLGPPAGAVSRPPPDSTSTPITATAVLAAGTVAEPWSAPLTVADTPSDGDSTARSQEPPPAEAAPLPLPAAQSADDALARLCRAQSFAAARAWAAGAPCVERLLARPGYRDLGPLIGLH